MDLTFILTEACNLRCRYCYQPAYPHSAMPVQIAATAMRQALDHGADSLSLTFFGGEPLMRDDVLFAILADARRLEQQRGVMITAKVATNGLLLDQAVLEQAGRLRLFISLSMDGDREAHDAGRVRADDGRGSFEQVDAALGRLVAWGKPFAIYSVVTPDNVARFARGRRYLWRRGARILISAIDYGGQWTPAAIAELERQYDRTGRFYERLMRKREGFHFDPFDNRIAARTHGDEHQRCAPGVKQLTVAPDGELFGCVEFFHRRSNPLGNVHDWVDEQVVKAAVKGLGRRASECADCAINDRCTNRCACVNLRTTGRADRPPQSLCLTEQATVLAADRIARRLYERHVPEFLMRHYSASYHMLSGIERYFEQLDMDAGKTQQHAGSRS